MELPKIGSHGEVIERNIFINHAFNAIGLKFESHYFHVAALLPLQSFMKDFTDECQRTRHLWDSVSLTLE